MKIHSVRRAVLALFLVTVVTSAAGAQRVIRLPEQDRPLNGRVLTVFSVGAMEGQSWEMLNNADQAVFDRNDNLYVLDRGNARVLMFDRAGRFVRQLGRKGGGPGEFEVPVSVAVLPGGSVAVLDLAHQNLSLFDADGRFLRTVPWKREWGMPGRQVQGEPRGGVLAMLRPGLTPEAVRAGNAPRTQALSRVPLLANEVLRRLVEIPDASIVQSSGSNTGTQRTVNFRMLGPPEFSPLTLWGVNQSGSVALTHTHLYTIKIFNINGDPILVMQRPVRVRRPTARDRQRARQRLREQLQSGRGMVMVTRRQGPGGGGAPPRGGGRLSREQIEERVREMQFSDTVRAIQGMTVATSGKLWVERTPANIGDPGPIDVLMPSGQYMGTVTGIRLPDAISLTGRAVWLERDENDVERIVVRQLPPGWF